MCTLQYPDTIRPQFLAPVVLAACIVVEFLHTVTVAISHLLSVPIQVSELIIVIKSCLYM